MSVDFDPKTLTDDDLLKKSNELMAKIVWASQFCQSLLPQLQDMLTILDNERNERYFMSNWDKASSLINAPLETDPQFNKKIEDKQSGNKKKTESKLVFNLIKNPTQNKD